MANLSLSTTIKKTVSTPTSKDFTYDSRDFAIALGFDFEDQSSNDIEVNDSATSFQIYVRGVATLYEDIGGWTALETIKPYVSFKITGGTSGGYKTIAVSNSDSGGCQAKASGCFTLAGVIDYDLYAAIRLISKTGPATGADQKFGFSVALKSFVTPSTTTVSWRHVGYWGSSSLIDANGDIIPEERPDPNATLSWPESDPVHSPYIQLQGQAVFET